MPRECRCLFRDARDRVVIEGMQCVVMAESLRDVDHLIFDGTTLSSM